MTDPFQRLVYRLVSGDPKLTIQAFLPDLVMLSGASSTLAILRFAEGEADLQQRLRSIIPLSRQGRLEIALVGGSEDARRLLKKATPMFQTNRIQTFHLPEGGRPWRSGTSSSAVWTALTDVAEGRAPEPDWPKLYPRIERDTTQAVRQHEELAAFGLALSSRWPIATYALLTAIVLAFVLEVLRGGSTRGVDLMLDISASIG